MLPRSRLMLLRPLLLLQQPSRRLQRPRRAASSSGTRKNDPSSVTVTGQQDTSGFTLVQHGKDDPPRLTCTSCGWVHYDNPKIVTGSVVVHEPAEGGEPLFLLCRRAIPPREGYLNLPAGYMEKGETLSASATREAREEATAQIECGPILALYDIAHIGQVHVYHLARLLNPESVRPGYESLDAQLLPWSAIDFDRLAFPTVSWALMHYQMHREANRRQRQPPWTPQPPFRNPVLAGHEGSTNVWFHPGKGGLVYDESWLRRRIDDEK